MRWMSGMQQVKLVEWKLERMIDYRFINIVEGTNIHHFEKWKYINLRIQFKFDAGKGSDMYFSGKK